MVPSYTAEVVPFCSAIDTAAIFQMNDVLLTIQQWEFKPEFVDMTGRFYAKGGLYGPPHASSTAVYVEGLIDAYKLARQLNDTARQVSYGRAIQGGLRSLMQLQFADEIDHFYIQEQRRWKTFGGFRTTVYDNRIRIDNVQHSLSAAIKYLSLDKPLPSLPAK